MAEKIRIGNEKGLLFEVGLKSSPKHEKGLAWGDLRIFLGHECVWTGEDESGKERPLFWTWIDILEFLGKSWSWLILEESYPIPVTPLFPHLLRREAEKRWEDLPAEQTRKEEEAVYRFLRRHDLAAALKGLFVPSLLLLRQGDQYIVSSAFDKKKVVRPRKEVTETLETFGEHIKEFAIGSDNHRANYAIELWQSRNTRLREQVLPLRTGLSEEQRLALQGDTPENEFWEIDPESPEQDSEILAAARMSRGVITTEDQKALLKEVRRTRKRHTPDLDKLTEQACQAFREREKPHNEGYWLANWTRKTLEFPPESPLDTDKLLKEWSVTVKQVDFPNSPIDAIAAWGKSHGPVILVNIGEGAKPSSSFGRRSTLAHEICHLLLDRKGALPVGEVLGGRVSPYAEKRARAFAAEFLLPRNIAADFVRRHPDIRAAVTALRNEFHVGGELLAWQILNSSEISLNEDEKTFLRNLGHTESQTTFHTLRKH